RLFFEFGGVRGAQVGEQRRVVARQPDGDADAKAVKPLNLLEKELYFIDRVGLDLDGTVGYVDGTAATDGRLEHIHELRHRLGARHHQPLIPWCASAYQFLQGTEVEVG